MILLYFLHTQLILFRARLLTPGYDFQVEDADVMSEFDQEIRNAAGSESGSDASSSSSNGSWLGVGYWVRATMSYSF